MPHLKKVNLAVILCQSPRLRMCGDFSIRLCTWCVVKQRDIFYKTVQYFHHPSLCVCNYGWTSFIDSEEEQCVSPVRISRNELGIECVYTNVEKDWSCTGRLQVMERCRTGQNWAVINFFFKYFMTMHIFFTMAITRIWGYVNLLHSKHCKFTYLHMHFLVLFS